MTKLLLIAILAFVTSLPVIGCKNPEVTAFKATGITVSTVDEGMQAWGDYVRAGLASPGDQRTVKQAYDRYYDAIQVERATIISFKSNPDTNQLQQVLGAVSAASSELLGALIKLLPPDKVVKIGGGS